MGIRLFSSSSRDKSHCMVGSSLRSASRFDDKRVIEASEKSLPNPDPKNYSILSHLQLGRYLVVKVQYHDCTNYEGKKILVFRTTLAKLKKQKYIDPHFCENRKFISPIARFVPTEEGLDDAIDYAKKKDKEK